MIRILPFVPLLLLAACSGGTDGAEDKAPEPIATVKSEAAALGTAGDTVALYGIAEAAQATSEP